MKVISTRVHGIMDYLIGALLIAAPFILDFDRGGAETWIPVILGALIILQALMTNFEMGVSRMLSMRMHLILDYLIGTFLAVSPWVFHFYEYVYLPHLLVGILIVGQAIMTRTVPEHGATTRHPYRGKETTSRPTH